MRKTGLAVMFAVAVSGLMVQSVGAAPTTNGWDTDRIYVIRGGAWDSEVRILNEAEPNVYAMDLGPFGTQAFGTWPVAVATPAVDPADGTSLDASLVKSICFSNSPVAGVNSPAGVRFFGVYDVRSIEPYVVTYYSSGFQIVEMNSAGKRIRVMQVGLAANSYPNNTSPDILTDPAWPNSADPVGTRNNVNGCRVGTIRYNRAKNTLCVAANIGDHDNGDVCWPPMGRVYEFELPDWPEVYYPADYPVVAMRGQPIPQSDPAVVKLVQLYEMPHRCVTATGETRYDVDRCQCLLGLGGTWYGHSISQNNGKIGRNPGQRPAIAFDDAGNMYFTSRFFNATTNPIHNGSAWVGEGLYQGDVLKVNTLGHWTGKNKYVVPVTGADQSNLVIQAQFEQDVPLSTAYPPNALYNGGPGLAVRGNQLIQVGEIECNDLNNPTFPYYVYVNLFDLTSTVGGTKSPYELVRTKSLSSNRCDIPRKPNYAQLDAVSLKAFLTNLMGACDCAQNFMYINPDDTVVHDVGYFLTVPNPNGSSAGTLTADWDATSPPGTAVDQIGACCMPGHSCQQQTQTECAAAGGFWQGNGTTCGQFPCEGACCRPCGACQQAMGGECVTLGGTWLGLGTACGQQACPLLCPGPPDGDCDGDVDVEDFAALQRCLTVGQTTPAIAAGCECFDKNGDHAIDATDLTVFVHCASGVGVPADPACH